MQQAGFQGGISTGTFLFRVTCMGTRVMLCRYTFWWVFPSIRAANRKARLSQEDLPKLPRVDPRSRSQMRSSLVSVGAIEHALSV